MINFIRRALFGIFRKLIPVSWIESAIREERVRSNSQYCRLDPKAILHHQARILNMQHDPDRIRVGANSLIVGELYVSAYGGEIRIGANSYVGEHSRVWSGESVIIGDHVQISHNVNISDTNTHSFDHEARVREYEEVLRFGSIQHKGSVVTRPVVIEDHAWISFNATILKGVRIGRGAVVGANSLVTKDVEPFTLVAGNPAVRIRSLQ